MAKSKIDYGEALFGDDAAPITGGNDAVPPDPVLPTRMPVTIDNLITYEGNPRTTQNPKFEEIKESIRADNLHHAPNVTRKSPTDPYMIRDGGNTRLQALKELWEETKDPRFFTIDCNFYPWNTESSVLLAHMIENDVRGGMTFIDKARGAIRLKDVYEAELNKELSINQLAKELTARGWPVKQPNLQVMAYTVRELLPWLPFTLDGGMGRPAINTTKRILSICREYWNDVSSDENGSFDEIWQQIFLELDDDGAFTPEIARARIEEAMADKLQISTSSVRAEIQCLESGVTKAAQRPTENASQVDLEEIVSQQGSVEEPSAKQKNSEPSTRKAPVVEAGTAVTEATNKKGFEEVPAIETKPLKVSQKDYSSGGINEALAKQRQNVLSGLRDIFAIFDLDADVIIETSDPIMCFAYNSEYFGLINNDNLELVLPFELGIEMFGLVSQMAQQPLGDCVLQGGAAEFMELHGRAQQAIPGSKETVQYGEVVKRLGKIRKPINNMTFEQIVNFKDAADRWNEEIIEYIALILNDGAGLI